MIESLDKSAWQKTKFYEVCQSINVSARDAHRSGFERYVGLEHIEPENLHIRSWGNVADGTTFTKTFKPGHVLFGKRRAYQKKAALPDFSGLCSGDILVFEAKKEAIDPLLLPFLVQSDGFFEFAVKTSAGSLSPRTKFQDLAQYEFLLPPLDQQAQLAKLLWAADEVVERYVEVETASKTTISSLFDAVYKQPNIEFLKLGNCLEYTQYGISEQLNEVSGLPVLRMNNLYRGQMVYDDLKYIDSVSDDLLLEKGDLLFNRTNSFDLVGKVALFNSDELMTFASYLIRLKPKTSVVMPDYLNAFLNSDKGQALIRKYRTPGVSQSNINPENLKKVIVPVLPIKEQVLLVQKLNSLDDVLSANIRLKENCQTLKNALINQIFAL